MKLAKVIAVSVLSGASIAYAATQMVTFKGTAELTAKVVGDNGDGLEIVKTETRFFIQHLFDAKLDKGLERVFKVVERETSNTLVDGQTDLSVIEAYQSKKGPLDTKLWSLKSHGGQFEIFTDDFVQVTESGCCDSPSINHLINSETGKKVVSTRNGTTLDISVPNSRLPFRYLAILEDPKAPAKRGTKEYVGSIGYFTNSQVKSIARIYAQKDENAAGDLYDFKLVKNAKDQLMGHSVTLWSTDGVKDAKAAFTGFGASGTIFVGNGGEKAFSILVDQDQISQQLSKVAPELEIEVVK